MGKLVLLLCLAFLAMSVVMACQPRGSSCRHSSECCRGLECNTREFRCVRYRLNPLLRIQEYEQEMSD
ncbi:unnamed protein product [Lasius platythorax]|uniref:Uncharacterized protein n=1 Tax=Lasius platythorax TaxID=488582 RepID=A0AAV2N6Q0_9HYME